MKILVVLISLFTVSFTLPVILTKARPRRQLPFGGTYPFIRPATGINTNYRLNNFNPVINIPDPPRTRAPTTTSAPVQQRSPGCRSQESQNPSALFLIPSSDPRGSPQAFLIPSLSGNQNTSNTLPTQIFVLPPSPGQSSVPGSGQLVPPTGQEPGAAFSGGQAPVVVAPGVFITTPENKPAGGVNTQPWTGQYPSKSGPYQNGGPPFTSGAGQIPTWPAGNTQYPSEGGQYPAGNTQYPSEGGQYPSGNTQYPSGNTQYPSGNTQYPSEGGQYPTGNTQYPSGNTQYPSEGGQYPTENTQYPSGNTQYPTENTQYPSGNTQHPTENTQYPSGTGQYPNWGGQYPPGTGQYPNWGGQYPAGNTQYPSGTGQYPNWGGQYPAGNTQYPSGTGQYPNWGGPNPAGNTQYPPGTGQYPNWGGPNPAGNTQYPPVTGQYPNWGGQYPPWTGQYPSGSDKYPSASAQYTPEPDQYTSETEQKTPEQDTVPGTGVKDERVKPWLMKGDN